MSLLAVWLGPTPDPQGRYPYLISRDGQQVHDQGQAQASLLPQPPRGGECVAIVPATLLSWHLVRLPKGVGPGSPRLRQVLEGLLEERLLTELADTHLAVAPTSITAADQEVWVAACDRIWLQQHLQILEGAQRVIGRIVPELAPTAEGLEVHVTGDAALPWLHASGAEVPGVLSLPLSPAVLPLLPPLVGDGSTSPDITAEPAVVESAETVLQAPVRLQTRADRLLAATRTAWDLAQMDFASTGWARAGKRMGSLWRDLVYAADWRPLRWGLALLAAVNLVGLNAVAWQAQLEHSARREAMSGLLTQTFPQVRLVVDAPVQMAREVAALRQRSGAPARGDLDVMLSAVAPHLGGLAPSDIEHTSPGELILKGISLQPEAFAALQQALAPAGLHAETDGMTLTLRPQGEQP